jgi:replication factor C large subunit
MPSVSRLPLAERLRPSRLDEVIGNPQARTQLRAWAERWGAQGTPAQRAAILSGPPGVGKTSAALALASDFGWSVVEMNASDARNERAIDQVAGRASITRTLLEGANGQAPGRALILLDEADSLSGRAVERARTVATPVPLREYLRGRYGTVESLNFSWGLAVGAKPAPFDSWESVPRSPGNNAWARLAPARKDIDDWKGAGRPHDNSDRGGLAAIARLVRSTRQPLVLTVNDDRVLTRYSPVFRTAVARVRFYPIRDRELAGQLAAIARHESLDVLPAAIDAIVHRAHGDLRAALNDLDAISPLPRGPLQMAILGTRDLEADFAAITEEALTAARYYRNVEIQDRLDATPDDLFPWIEENLPHFAPDAAHASAAFDRLGAAEWALARARRFRVWGLWSYASELMTGGVGLAIRDAPVPVAGRAQFPRFLGEMGGSRTARALRDSVARKSGRRFHLSRAKVRESVMPFLEQFFEPPDRRRPAAPDAAIARRLVRELDLTAEEVGYLAGREPDSDFVLELIAGDSPVSVPETPEPAEVELTPAPASPEPEVAPPRERKSTQRQLSDFSGR